MAIQKLCPHIISGYNGELGQPGAIKLVNVSAEYVKEIRTAHPKALIVIRWVEDNIALDDPEGAACDWFERHLHDMEAMNDPNVAFEAINEPNNALVDQATAFEVTRLRLAHEHGFRSVIFNTPEGVFDFPLWERTLPALREMQEGDFVGLHEYGNGHFPVGSHPNFPWHCGRFTRVPELRGISKLITESGVDAVEGAAPGWRLQFNGDFAPYLTWLQQADVFYQQYDEVPWVFVFTLGLGWPNHNVDAHWHRIVELYGEAPEPPPEPDYKALYEEQLQRNQALQARIDAALRALKGEE